MARFTFVHSFISFEGAERTLIHVSADKEGSAVREPDGTGRVNQSPLYAEKLIFTSAFMNHDHETCISRHSYRVSGSKEGKAVLASSTWAREATTPDASLCRLNRRDGWSDGGS